ncbi:MAG: transposase [Bacteroidales bacterium]|jgi:REP element-mobilizing transposase RayT|nr:transposase [Bacteroidales bacterium]MBQ9435163.1 transposase [Bacteroidales bacterium]
MAQSLAQVYIHLVFHTKYSSVTIREEDLPKLFAYIDGIVVNQNAMVIQIGGVPNHIHILCTLPRIVSMANFVEEIKKCSSRWIKTLDSYYSKFAWQGGYGIFSVSASQVQKVKDYVTNQKEHHRKKTFQEEYEAFLKAYNIEYNPEYVFKD